MSVLLKKASSDAPIRAVEVSGLSYCYEGRISALEGISFSVEEKERVGVIGPNGSGKSTLLMHLNGILPEDRGNNSSVRIFGESIAEENLRQVRRKVGLLFQNTDDQLFCPTVFEDIAFGPEQFGLKGDELRRRVQMALCAVGLEGYEDRLPHHLSNGEKRRVCLAGVLVCDPNILLLDEPTSDLDPRGRRELKNLLSGLAATLVIASHDLDLVAELCTRVIVLDRGSLVAEGPTAEVLSNESLMLEHGLERPFGLSS